MKKNRAWGGSLCFYFLFSCFSAFLPFHSGDGAVLPARRDLSCSIQPGLGIA